MLTLPPDLRDVVRARRFVTEVATEAGFPEDRVFDITVACSEAAANAVEHASVKEHIEVRTLLHPDRLEIEIAGPGEFQTPQRLNQRKSRGLGLPMMATLSDHLALYSRPGGGTLVTLTFYLPGVGAKDEEESLPPSMRELIESNELLSMITSTAPMGIFVLGTDFRFRWVNPTYQSFLPPVYRSADLVGRSICEVGRAAGTGGLVDLARVSLGGEALLNLEYRFGRDGAEAEWFRVNIVPLKRESTGPPYDVLVVIMEETERKRAEEALRRSEEKFRVIASNFPDTIFFQDADLRYVWIFNPASRLEAEQVEGKTDADLLPADEAALLTEIKREVLNTGRGVSKELQLSPGGITRWYEAVYEPSRDGKGDIVGLLSYSRDITQRKKAEQELEAAGRRYQALVDHSGLGFTLCRTIFDAQGRAVDFEFVEVNRLHQEFTGLRPEQVLGKKVSEVIPGFSQEHIDLHNAVALGGGSREEEIHEANLDRWYRLNLYSPEYGYFVSLFTDLTHQKRAEAAPVLAPGASAAESGTPAPASDASDG